jgi:hypothetical protein
MMTIQVLWFIRLCEVMFNDVSEKLTLSIQRFKEYEKFTDQHSIIFQKL